MKLSSQPRSRYVTEKQMAAKALIQAPFTPELVAQVQREARNKHDERVLADREYTNEDL